MSGVNNVALWTGIQASPYVPFVNIAPIIAIIIKNGIAFEVYFFNPVLQVETDATSNVNGSQKDCRDTVRAGNNWSDIDKWHIWASLLTCPYGNIVDTRHT